MMRVHVLRLVARISVVLVAVGLAVPLSAQKSGQSAGEFYLSYLAAAEKMKSLKELVPFMPKDQAAMFAKIPKDLEKDFLEQARKETIAGAKVLKETPDKEGYLLEVEGTRKATKEKVKGWARIIREDGALKLAKDDWSGNPPPAPPKIPASVTESGKAVGEFTANGQMAKLSYAYAYATPDSFDKTKTAYHVILSDVAWNPKDYNQNDRVKAGTLHYIELSIGSDKRIDGTMMYHRALKQGLMSSAGGQHKLDTEKIGPDFVAGRAYLEGPENALGENIYYAAAFRAPVDKTRK
jgi:hypothetical protein